MKFVCPHCTGHLEADADMAGMQFACPHCQTLIVVPGEPEMSARPPEPITPPPSGRISRKRSGILAPSIAGGVALLIVLTAWLLIRRPTDGRLAQSKTVPQTEQIMGTKKREPAEVSYVEQLLRTRTSLLALEKSWEAVNSPNGMLDGLESFSGNMRAFNTSLNGLYQVGATFVEAHPEFKENNDRIKLPPTVNFTIGNPSAKMALTNVQNAIEQALALLEVNYQASN